MRRNFDGHLPPLQDDILFPVANICLSTNLMGLRYDMRMVNPIASGLHHKRRHKRVNVDEMLAVWPSTARSMHGYMSQIHTYMHVQLRATTWNDVDTWSHLTNNYVPNFSNLEDIKRNFANIIQETIFSEVDCFQASTESWPYPHIAHNHGMVERRIFLSLSLFPFTFLSFCYPIKSLWGLDS
jgi:hypothetical protein